MLAGVAQETAKKTKKKKKREFYINKQRVYFTLDYNSGKWHIIKFKFKLY